MTNNIIEVLEPIPAEVTEAFLELGVPQNIKGYNYLRVAVTLCIRNPEKAESIVKGLYYEVADLFNTTPSRAERAMRHAVERTWDNGDLDLRDKYFGNTVSSERGRPTNSEFISLMANTLRKQVLRPIETPEAHKLKRQLNEMRERLVDEFLVRNNAEYAALYSKVMEVTNND